MPNYRLILTDGSAQVNLYGGTGSLVRQEGLNMPAPIIRQQLTPYTFDDGARLSSAKYETRNISIKTKLSGSNALDLRSNIRTIHRLLNDAEKRTLSGYGSKVYLEYQWGDTAGSSTYYDVLRGDLTLPSNYLSPIFDKSKVISDAQINLTCKPFGRYANQTIAQDTLENEISGANLCYKDITTTENYGDVPARLYTKIAQTGAIGTGTVWVGKRSGSRYQDNLWNQAELYTAIGTIGAGVTTGLIADAVMSGGTVLEIKSTSQQQGSTTAGTAYYTFSSPPEGQYRVLTRCKINRPNSDWNELGWGMGWTYGNKTYTPTAAKGEYYTNSTANTYQILDLGLLNIPPIPKSDLALNNQFTLTLYALTKTTTTPPQGTMYWTSDFIFLLPIDEGCIIAGSINPTDVLAIDGITDPSNVYTLTTGGSINNFPDYRGAPFTLGRENTRLYVLKDDVKATTFAVDLTYQPLFLTI